MAYFDYSPPKSAFDITQGLNSFGDALTDVLNRRQKQKEVDAKLALDQTQQAINNRKAREDTARFGMEQQKNRQAMTDRVRQRWDSGDVQGAQAEAHSYREYDPETGQTSPPGSFDPGPAANVGPAPQMPPPLPAPPEPVPPEIAARRKNLIYKSQGAPMPPAFGVDPTQPPIITDDGKPPSMEAMGMDPEFHSFIAEDQADKAAEDKANEAQKTFDAQKTGYDLEAQQFPQKTLDYLAQQKKAEADRPYTLKLGPNDKGTQFTASQRDNQRSKAADDFLAAFDGLTLTPEERQVISANHGAIASGASTPQQAMADYRKFHATGQSETFKHGEGLIRDAAAQKRAETMAGARGNDAKIGQLHESQEAGTVRDIKEFQQDFRDWETRAAQVAGQSKGYTRLAMALKNINAPNAVTQHEAQSALGSFFSGGGAAREFEQKFLYNHLAGLGGQAETTLEHIRSGQMGPQELAVVTSAVQDALREQKERAQELYDSAKLGYGPGSGYENFGGNVDAKVRATLKALGYDAEPMYPGVEPVHLGDIVRPYRAQNKPGLKPPRPAGAPPEIKAKDKAKANSALDEAMQ